MVNNSIWIGIVVGVFFAGLGIGYAVLQSNSTPNFMPMSNQQMQQMMNDPDFRQQMLAQWRQNPQTLNSWMNQMMVDPQLMTQMHQVLLDNPQYMRQMPETMGPYMTRMMDDPQLRQQMIGQMLQHQEFMYSMMNNTNFQQNWMGSMMGPDYRGFGGMGPGMMSNP